MAQPGDPVQQVDHAAGVLGTLVDARRILGIDQHDIAAGGLDARDALFHLVLGLGGIEAAQHGIGADLPDHEIGVGVEHRGLQPLHHLGRVLAALAAVEHGDVGGRILPLQLRKQPVRIGEVRRARAPALRRGRAEGDDHDRKTGGELACDMRQRSHRRHAALRRRARHAAENVAGGFRHLLHGVDRARGDGLLRRRIGGLPLVAVPVVDPAGAADGSGGVAGCDGVCRLRGRRSEAGAAAVCTGCAVSARATSSEAGTGQRERKRDERAKRAAEARQRH